MKINKALCQNREPGALKIATREASASVGCQKLAFKLLHRLSWAKSLLNFTYLPNGFRILIRTAGLIVDVTAIFLIYWPLAAAGLTLIRVSTNVR